MSTASIKPELKILKINDTSPEECFGLFSLFLSSVRKKAQVYKLSSSIVPSTW